MRSVYMSAYPVDCIPQVVESLQLRAKTLLPEEGLNTEMLLQRRELK